MNTFSESWFTFSPSRRYKVIDTVHCIACKFPAMLNSPCKLHKQFSVNLVSLGVPDRPHAVGHARIFSPVTGTINHSAAKTRRAFRF